MNKPMQPPTCNRRQLLALAAGAAAAGPLAARAQTGFATRPVKVVVPFAAGGATDVITRVLGEHMGKRFGQPVVVDNKPGGAGLIAGEMVVKSPPDGMTVLLGTTSSMLTNKYLYKKPPYDPLADLTPLVRVCLAPIALVVTNDVPAQNLQEFMAWLRANKGKLSYGSYGQGSFPHLMGAYLDHVTGGGMNHVAYKGEAPMIQDLLGGQFDLCWSSAINTKQHIASGKLKAIGINAPYTVAALPGVPALKDSGMKEAPFSMVGWLAMAVPAKTPKAIQEKLAAEIRAAIADPEVRRKIEDMGFGPIDNSGPEAFAADYKRELPRWQELVKLSGAKLD